jgi:hypothetical protein
MTSPFDALTQFGLQGYAVTLSFGGMFGAPVWTCIIGARTVGSVTIGMMSDPSVGHHPTDPSKAAQFALVDFTQRHPEAL